MKRTLSTILVAIVCLVAQGFFAPKLFARTPSQTSVRPVALAPAEIDRIVRALTVKETEFRRALNQYGFKRDAVIQTLGAGEHITGEYHRTSIFTFDDSGNRYEKITFFPMPTLTEIVFSNNDLEDLGGIQTFALEAAKINQYNFSYLGKQRIDELDLYVFDVAPKVMPDLKKTKERFFQGRIWVDDQDLQIVKARGKGVPEGKDAKYPTFETYREQIDGKFWFPAYTYADDQLTFSNGNIAHLRMAVRYTDYKRGRGKLIILDDDSEPVKEPTVAPAPSKRKP